MSVSSGVLFFLSFVSPTQELSCHLHWPSTIFPIPIPNHQPPPSAVSPQIHGPQSDPPTPQYRSHHRRSRRVHNTTTESRPHPGDKIKMSWLFVSVWFSSGGTIKWEASPQPRPHSACPVCRTQYSQDDDDNYYSSEEMSRKRSSSSNNKENIQFISFELPSFLSFSPSRRRFGKTKSIDGVIIV